MSKLLRYIGYLAALGLAGVYVFLLVAGPQPLSNINKTQQQLRRMEEENENLRKDIARRKTYLDELERDRSKQDLEIRKGLNKQRDGETTIFLPENK
jgi:septal ring factor EnvC (AmiA/AmiB activator)